MSKYQGNVPALRALIDDCTLHAGGTEGATSGAATDQLAAPAPGKKRKRVDFNPAGKVRSLVEVVLGRAVVLTAPHQMLAGAVPGLAPDVPRER